MNKKSFPLLTIFSGFLILILGCCLSWAQETPSPEQAEKGIRIFTDQAIVDSKARHTEFSGNVKLTLNETQINADWMKITYNEDIQNVSNMSVDQKAIDTISAKGNVTIQMNDMVANTQEAVYSFADERLLLTGENTTLTSGDDTIVCDRVKINMKDQTFKAESTGKTPVEAIFYNKPEKQQNLN